MKANAYEGALDQDKMTRASLPMGVLQGYRSAVQWTADLCWPKTANTVPSFNGKTPCPDHVRRRQTSDDENAPAY